MDINNYIIPIYKGKEFVGTGFIAGSTLITAAHVIETPTLNYSCLWDGETVRLSCANILWHEHPEADYMQGQGNKYLDLAIYKMDDVESPLELSAPDLGYSCNYWGYSFDEDNKCLLEDSYSDIFLNDKTKYYPRSGGRAIPIKNCYLSDIGRCKEGNSGGPLFQGEKVVAMLSGNQDYGDFSKDRYIKSEYIMSVLSSISK